MGGQISLESNLDENVSLRRFCGLEPLSDNAPDWNQLLSFNITQPKTKVEAKQWNDKCEELCQSLLLNTGTTANFAAFIRVLLRRMAELKSSAQCDEKIFIWQATNGITILKFVCRYFSSRMSESEFQAVFRKQVLSADGRLENVTSDLEGEESPAEELLNALIQIIVDVPLNDSTEKLHLESMHCLLELLSVEMYNDKPVASTFFKYFLSGRCAIHAPLLTKQLLGNFATRVNAVSDSKQSVPGSLVIGLATSMWNALQLASSDDDAESDKVDVESVGSCSLLLLLILVSHHPPPNIKLNPYHAAIASFQNTQELSSLTNPTHSVVSFKVDFSQLYQRLCDSVGNESAMLLLYFVLHNNSGFRNFLLSRVNLENLVLPVLKVLNSGQAGTSASSHHVYLALIVMLILTEDDFFCKVVHETTVTASQCDWFSERPVGEISLGGLIILILVKTIQYNVVKVRDRYLHTNCLAALANMSAHFKHLPATVCQKLIGLLELLTKRHAKLVDSLRQSAEYDLNTETDENSSYQQDITALEEGMRTLLEILNSCVTHGLRHNPHLIYTMLYKRQLFDGFHQHPMFQDIIWNLTALLNHFSGRVSTLGTGASVHDVLDAIQKGAIQWPTDRLKKFPELKFKYIEDENTEEFFIPYVWAIMCKQSHYYTDPTKIKLFNAHPALIK